LVEMTGYKFFWKVRERGIGGISIFVAKQYLNKFVEMTRVSYRFIVLQVMIEKKVLIVISVYAPQLDRSDE
jgi:exonuclease III